MNWELAKIDLEPWEMLEMPMKPMLKQNGDRNGRLQVPSLQNGRLLPYLGLNYLIYYSYWGYPIHKDRINQIRGQKTTGVAERGNRRKRVCNCKIC